MGIEEEVGGRISRAQWGLKRIGRRAQLRRDLSFPTVVKTIPSCAFWLPRSFPVFHVQLNFTSLPPSLPAAGSQQRSGIDQNLAPAT